jgi:hypothetical protein
MAAHSARAAVAAEPDPIFAAIERYKLAHASFLERCDWEDAQEEAGITLNPSEMDAHGHASVAAREDLWRTAPTTPAGLVAYLDFVVAASEERDGDPEPSGDDEMMDFLRTLARAAREMAAQLKPRAISGEDPIFAAITAHRQAWKNTDGPEDIEDADWEPVEAAQAALMNPTTNAGAAALLRYVHKIAADLDQLENTPFKLWLHSVYLNVADMLEGRVAS